MQFVEPILVVLQSVVQIGQGLVWGVCAAESRTHPHLSKLEAQIAQVDIGHNHIKIRPGPWVVPDTGLKVVHTVDPQRHQLQHGPMPKHIIPRQQRQRVLLLGGLDHFSDPSREEGTLASLTHEKFTLFARWVVENLVCTQMQLRYILLTDQINDLADHLHHQI